jgi:alkanesulfonate monooxygenase SsuD/methylene tetrahydromethanopterin reductase-like flavin-dependent oxidoreductase (luciferase family)
MLQKGAAEAGRAPLPAEWRVSRTIHVAASDAEAHDHVHDPRSSFQHYYGYFREILGGLGKLVALKARPDMRDDEVTVDNILESRLIYGSPQTVLDKLVAFRDTAGPFGSLLFTGVDWTGPNEAWERQSMNRLATEVMPRFAQHAAAKAAE